MAAELHCNYRTRLPQWSGAARYGSNTEMLQQIAPSRLTCRKVPKAFLFAGRANYPDNAFFDKESAQSQAKGFSFYTAKCFSFLKKRGDPQRFPLHMPLHAPPFWLFIQGHKPWHFSERQWEPCFSLMSIYYLSLLHSLGNPGAWTHREVVLWGHQGRRSQIYAGGGVRGHSSLHNSEALSSTSCLC